MADHTKIEWTDASWNPVRGCTRVSEGCKNCYAERMAARFNRPGQWGRNLAELVRRPDGTSEARWTDTIEFNGKALDQPLRWRKPRRIFVCSTSDLFHEHVPSGWIDQVFAVMALSPQHTFQVLTKRPQRLQEYLTRAAEDGEDWLLSTPMSHPAGQARVSDLMWPRPEWPLDNVWLGVSAENQATADQRIPPLLDTPAAVRFLSAEPLLGPIDLNRLTFKHCPTHDHGGGFCIQDCGDWQTLDWVIAGGESGPRARPMHPDWARALRDQCRVAGVAFFFKQWGEWGPDVGPPPGRKDRIIEGLARCAWFDGSRWHFAATGYDVDLAASKGCGDWVYRLGKKATGRLLAGRQWSEMPEGDDP